jgi:4-alpha-glucanotransferase
VYTGTHDNDTTVGWWNDRGSGASTRTPEQIEAEREVARLYTGTDGRRIHWDMIRLALASVADLAVFPAQDVLGLGSEARMNVPGTLEGNWLWRMAPAALSTEVARELRALTKVTGRRAHRP